MHMNFLRQGAIWMTGITLAAHLTRGAISIALAAGGLAILDSYPTIGIGMVFSALIPIGGCPACWLGGTIGAVCTYRPKASLKEK
jgi:hypothetical protein